MMDTMTRFTKLQDDWFDMMKRVEQPVVRTTGQLAERMARYTPPRPAFMETVPRMTEVVDNGLKFRKRMVDEQAMFARHMIKAMGPVLTKLDAAPAPKKAEHTTARKASARPAPRRQMHAA
jgi:hypothetical protein